MKKLIITTITGTAYVTIVLGIFCIKLRIKNLESLSPDFTNMFYTIKNFQVIVT